MKLMPQNRKGQLATLGSAAVGIATLTVVLTVTFLVLSKGKTQALSSEGLVNNGTDCAKSTACNATVTLTNAVADVPTWVPLIILVIVGVVILGLIKMFR